MKPRLPARTDAPASRASKSAASGMFLGLLGVLVFSATLPMTRLAGGVARVGQLQLLQPFFTVLLAALVLGEMLTWTTLGFAAAVIATVAAGRRMQVR